jgi:hypothetical protein
MNNIDTMIEVTPFEYREFILYFQKVSPSKRMKIKREGERRIVKDLSNQQVCVEHHRLGMSQFQISEDWYKKFKENKGAR